MNKNSCVVNYNFIFINKLYFVEILKNNKIFLFFSKNKKIFKIYEKLIKFNIQIDIQKNLINKLHTL